MSGNVGSSIVVSTDGGHTFQKVFSATGALLGFAVSPDGAEIAFGGPDDGLWVGPSDGTGFTRQISSQYS